MNKTIDRDKKVKIGEYTPSVTYKLEATGKSLRTYVNGGDFTEEQVEKIEALFDSIEDTIMSIIHS